MYHHHHQLIHLILSGRHLILGSWVNRPISHTPIGISCGLIFGLSNHLLFISSNSNHFHLWLVHFHAASSIGSSSIQIEHHDFHAQCFSPTTASSHLRNTNKYNYKQMDAHFANTSLLGKELPLVFLHLMRGIGS